MTKAKTTAPKTRARTANVAPDPTQASGLNAMADMAVQDTHAGALDDMAGNEEALHKGLYDMHEAAMAADGDVHGTDSFPENWKPPAELDAPPPQPGMVQRWIRMAMRGEADANNLADQGKQGWRPRSLESVPEAQRKNFPTMKDPRGAGTFLVNKDLVLCEMPERLFKQMADHYRNRAANLTASLVDKPLTDDRVANSENHGIGAPYVAERSTKVTTGRSPIVAADA